MTREVLVTIEGQQKGVEEEPIVTIATGTYHFTNGRHYIQYDERLEENGIITKNMIKIAPSQVVLSKKFKHSSQMTFDLNEITQSAYHTPYGDLSLDIETTSILVDEQPERIEVSMNYILLNNERPISDNSITITISSTLI